MTPRDPPASPVMAIPTDDGSGADETTVGERVRSVALGPRWESWTRNRAPDSGHCAFDV